MTILNPVSVPLRLRPLSAFVPSYAGHVLSCSGEGEGGRALHSPVPYKEFALENTKSPVLPFLSTECTL